MNNWYDKIENQISDQLKGTREKDLRFFRIEEYLRMAKRVEAFASSCRACNSFKYEIEKTAGTVGKAVTSPGRSRKMYDHLLGKLSKHMQKQHGFYPPFYFTYLLSVLYALIASLSAFVLRFLFSETDKWLFIIPAFILGLVSGNLRGAKKDSKIRSSKKLL